MIHPNHAITDANAVNSPLLRLPAEIRQMILRMVVGDKLIHVYSVYYDTPSDVNSDEEGFLQRSLCVAERIRPSDSATSHATTPKIPSANESESPSGQIHANCPNSNRSEEFEYKTVSRIFRISRHISREALNIFWHTNQFCVTTPGALNNLLRTLREFGMENVLRHLVILYPYSSYGTCKWAKVSAPSSLTALRGLVSLELRIELYRCVKSTSSCEGDQSPLIDECLEPFHNLRLLNLKKVSVSISYHGKVSQQHLERHELQTTAEYFRQRLLDPVISPQEYLVDSIQKLEKSLRKLERRARRHTNLIQGHQQELDAVRLKKERAKVEINELRAIFQRNNTAEIERVLQTDERSPFSHEE